MPVVFPTGRRPALRQSPRILLLYSPPKTAKTAKIAELPNCLIIDWEHGTDEHECAPVHVETLVEYNEVINTLKAQQEELRKKTGNPHAFLYDYIAIDTIDELEDACIKYETLMYNYDVKMNPVDREGKKRLPVKSVTDLAYGAGYGYVRERVKERMLEAGKYCKYLIITSHIKDKLMAGTDEKVGADVSDIEISLSGKLSTIIMSRASAIGYVYRDDSVMVDYKGKKVPQIMISFDTIASRAAAGSRSSHLAGVRMPFEWDKIYVD